MKNWVQVTCWNNLCRARWQYLFWNYPHDFTLPFLVVPFLWVFWRRVGEGLFFFLIKFELIPLCSQLLACNNSPLKHEQWEKICYLLCHSLSHMLQDVGQASLPTWEPLGTIPATVSLHSSDTFTILPWWTLSLSFTTELLSQILTASGTDHITTYTSLI